MRMTMKFLNLAKQLAGEMADEPTIADERQLHHDMTADLATAEDIAALTWISDRDDGATLRELLALDHRAHELIAADAPEAEVRAAVERFVAKVHAMREQYRRERTA
jgi:hypothetical protein